MSGVSMCQMVEKGVGSVVGAYKPGVYVPLKALLSRFFSFKHSWSVLPEKKLL